eukprot:1703437-Alexandrium_andersonii.AAC.1
MRLGEPVLASLTTPAVAVASMTLSTSAGVRLESSDRISAQAPATCGQAMEVPLMDAVPVSP